MGKEKNGTKANNGQHNIYIKLNIEQCEFQTFFLTVLRNVDIYIYYGIFQDEDTLVCINKTINSTYFIP